MVEFESVELTLKNVHVEFVLTLFEFDFVDIIADALIVPDGALAWNGLALLTVFIVIDWLVCLLRIENLLVAFSQILETIILAV